MKRLVQIFLVVLTLFAGIHRLFAPIIAGTLQVYLLPVSAANAGARWQVDGGGSFQTNGQTYFISTGSHTVTFAPITGWITPLSETVTVFSAQTTITNGTYVLTNNPAITLSLSATNNLTLSWPSVWTNWVLQQNADLTTTNWTLPGATVSNDGATKSVVVTNPATGNLFFRLKL